MSSPYRWKRSFTGIRFKVILKRKLKYRHGARLGGDVDGKPYELLNMLCAAAVSLVLGCIGRWSGREIARSTLSLAHPAQAERDNDSCFFVHAAGVYRFIRRSHVKKV
ncbi:hypothetical protein EVAR_51890_1 [Eumeta japonica]|uniref:Uncharacterized protein n=1 Tax=Eumeta variegata TaxID=151549 RepID=A0A4C1XJG5_EUMVA|nr:hypothetical protein EVAR_51890_1 [Eumeta japonica]